MEELIHLQIGMAAPEFHLRDLAGASRSLRDALGRICVVNFWSAECPWSERVDKDLLPYLQQWGSQVIYYPIASNANEPEEMLRDVANSRKLPPVLLDPQHKVADLYGAFTTPHFYVIDENGILRYQGAYDDVTFRQRSPTRQFLVPAVEALLKGKNPDPAETPGYGCTIVRSNEFF